MEVDSVQNRDFASKLKILLYGYLIMGMSIEKTKTSRFPDQTNVNLNAKQFYENGLKLSSKYFRNDTLLTKKFEERLGKNTKGEFIY